MKNIFLRYVKIGQEVKLGQKITKTHETIKPFQVDVVFEIFKSNIESPMYTDGKDCTNIGKLIIKIPAPSEETRKILVQMVFGNTELMLTAQDIASGEKCETAFDLI